MAMNPSLYFKQIEIGPMHNYVYLVGSTETREAAVVDAAWDIDEFSGLRRRTRWKLRMIL